MIVPSFDVYLKSDYAPVHVLGPATRTEWKTGRLLITAEVIFIITTIIMRPDSSCKTFSHRTSCTVYMGWGRGGSLVALAWLPVGGLFGSSTVYLHRWIFCLEYFIQRNIIRHNTLRVNLIKTDESASALNAPRVNHRMVSLFCFGTAATIPAVQPTHSESFTRWNTSVRRRRNFVKCFKLRDLKITRR